MANLRILVLNLEKCNHVLTEETFNGLINLQHLELLNGHFKQLKSNIFSCMSKLKILIVTNNQICNINLGAFNGLVSVEEIVFNHNNVNKIDFSNKISHQYQSIYSKRTSILNSTVTVKNFIFLKNFDLSSNKIKILRKNSFQKFSNLISLDLSQNNLKCIENGVFIGLKSLIKLNLGGNSIFQLKKQSFDGLDSLEELYLNANKINVLDSDIFRQLKSLALLDLSDNLLNNNNSFSGEFSSQSFFNLKKLNLACNSFELINLKTFSHMQNLVELNLYKNQIHRIESHAFSSMINLKRLILHENLIEDFMEDAFEGLLNLELLIVSQNLSHVLKLNQYLNKLYFLKIEC